MTFPHVLEALRRRALATQDALEYARLCDEVGVKPEDEFLYEKGTSVESAVNTSRTGGLEQRLPQLTKEQRLTAFVDEASEFMVRGYPLEKNADLKREVLIKYFPDRFGSGKKQDITDYDERKIGSLFREVYFNYKNRNN